MFKHKILLTTLACTSIAGNALAADSQGFKLFNSTKYANADQINHLGMKSLTSIYDQWHLSCNDDGCQNVPDEVDFDRALDKSAEQFKSTDYIVFDFEKISITGSRSLQQARNEALLFNKFIAWTRTHYPRAKIGMYDYDYNSNYGDIKSSLYREGGFDFFAPTLYQRWNTHADWENNVKKAIINDHEENQNLPIIAYISPYQAGAVDKGLLALNEWANELNDLRKLGVNGGIIWMHSNPTDTLDLTQPWVSTLKNFIANSAGIRR